jgi:hypothetical protein
MTYEKINGLKFFFSFGSSKISFFFLEEIGTKKDILIIYRLQRRMNRFIRINHSFNFYYFCASDAHNFEKSDKDKTSLFNMKGFEIPYYRKID